MALGNVRTIFWDAFVEQMRSDGREIGSVQFKDFSRGFFMAYFEHISQKDNSQAQGSVVKTMISKQICLRTTFGDDGNAVRRICQLYNALKTRAKAKLKECRDKKQNVSMSLGWFNE